MRALISPVPRANPMAGDVLRRLALHHHTLQLGQDRFRLGECETEDCERANHHRPAERDQSGYLRLAPVRFYLQPHRPLYQARPCGQTSANSINRGRASGLPQAFTLPCLPTANRRLTSIGASMPTGPATACRRSASAAPAINRCPQKRPSVPQSPSTQNQKASQVG